MAKIIPLPTHTDPLSENVHSVWLLAYAILWNHDQLPLQEQLYAKSIIRKYLLAGKLSEQTFIVICERLLLAGKLLQVEPATWTDLPAIWFHPEFKEGFCSTLLLQQQVAEKRNSISSYQNGILSFSRHYWRYTQRPSPNTLQQAYRSLTKLREYGLLQTWNNVIMLHLINSKPF